MPTLDPIPNSYSLSWGAVCGNCIFTLPPLDKLATAYFAGKEIVCEECQTPVDLWESSMKVLRNTKMAPFGLVTLGAIQTNFRFDLSAGETQEIDLTQHGVPEGATILDLIFTPQGGNCFPLMVHANRAYVRGIGTKFHIYGRPLIGSTDLGGVISGLVVWAHRNDVDGFSWSYLIDAFDAAARHRWSNVILPAYIAFEITLMPLVRASLERFVSKKKIEDIHPRDLSSSTAFNIFLPILAAAANLHLPPGPLCGQLNRLRKLRNDIVHEGVSKAEVDEQMAGEALCAVVFGLEYLRYARPGLLAAGVRDA